jgi:hypothetical protein
MKAWARGHLQKYLLPSECLWFQKLAVAIALHEADEAVIDRQRPVWLRDLAAMLAAQNSTDDSPRDEMSDGAAKSLIASLTGKG